MFKQCDNIIEIDFSNLDTKNVIDMSRMFYCCESLNKLNFTNFDTKYLMI